MSFRPVGTQNSRNTQTFSDVLTQCTAIALGHVGTAEEVAAAVSFFCSPGASYITGQVLGVNGGMYS
jgi:NAD(P)-dependent dehydrogenase (short-subunit alcohol dehydrogenase family)